jgi:hypothetical protein
VQGFYAGPFSEMYLRNSIGNNCFLFGGSAEDSCRLRGPKYVCWREQKNVIWALEQGCQMVCFQTKNPNLGKLWRFLQSKTLAYFVTILVCLTAIGTILYFIWYILWSFGIFFLVVVCCNKKIWQPFPGGVACILSAENVWSLWVVGSSPAGVEIRVARWYIFRPKITIWVYFGGRRNRKFSRYLEYFKATWYILCSSSNVAVIWYFLPVWVNCTKKNLTALVAILSK